jgi:hypothetical protein
MLTAALLITWAAAAYRLILSWSQPRTIWRTSFTAVMVALAVAVTIYRFREPIDQLLHTPNLAGLLSRLVAVVGLGCLLVYLHALRAEVVPARALLLYILITWAVAATLAVSWVLGPFHTSELDDLRVVPSVATSVYCLSFWLFLGLASIATASTCLRRRRAVRHQDRAREVSLLLSASGALVGLAVAMLWSVSLAWPVGSLGSALNGWADRLMPVACALIAAGVICMLVVPLLMSLIVTWRRWRALRPLWAALMERYPQVRLDVRPRGGPLTRMQFRMERMIIETFDALRLAPVGDPVPGVAGVETVARSLHRETEPRWSRHAVDLLDHVDSRDADVDQLIRLAGAYERLHHAAA